VPVGKPFPDRLQIREDEGIIDLAAVKDRALLRSNLSASAVQWHGDAAHLGGRSFVQTMLLAQSGKSPPHARFGRAWIRKYAKTE